ncbi:DUF1275 family protein [Devosia pacifica]|uniref:DUF1275 family protein n=1 Tax=Devosia pacifica TaxID=1335967 RepID=A0A918VN93_9HYPH|nr:YoaK family protein [Devosia pacifica]GHA10886.1 DUF1275 family protein [Devosia pacifica]
MLVHAGESRTVSIDLRLAAMLAAVAGAVNGAGFYAVGYFSANMTGNVSSLSDALALGSMSVAGVMLALLAAYIGGSFMSALLIEAGRRRHIRGIYAFSIVLEGILLGSLGLADLLLPEIHSGPILVLGLAFLMGLQNATTTRISNARVRTTHVSGIATDLGIELAILFGGATSRDEKQIVRSRFLLHATTLLCFLAGGVVGVLGYAAAGGILMLAVALLLLLVAVPGTRRPRKVRHNA